MRIERLELCGYKRLMLNNINRLVYTPTASYQLILGTNGSGKSSVLHELSPLPAHSSNYTKDGFKDITISHRGMEYRLVSTFKTGKHSFKVDGEEHNPGGTGEVQRRLVEQHFNLTKDLHELLTGAVSFTLMSPMERRKWITALSTMDYTYALGVYKRLATMARDNQGAVRHIKQRLTQETNNLSALSELDGLEERAEQIRQELNALLSSRTPGVQSFNVMSARLQDLLAQIEQMSRTVVRAMEKMPLGRTYRSFQDVQEDVQRLDGEVHTQQALLSRYTTEYSDLESIVQSLQLDGDITPENIEQHILELETELSRWKGQIKIFHGLADPQDLQRDTRAVLTELIGLFKALPDNSDRHLSRETVQQAKDRLTVHRSTVDKGTIQLVQLETRIKLINSAKDTTCPSCHYVWREGYSQAELDQCEKWVDEHTAIVDRARKNIEEEQRFLEAAEIYAGQCQRFRGFVGGYPRMSALWDYLAEHRCLTDRPNEQIDIFFTWQKDVEISCTIDELERKLIHLTELAARQKQNDGGTHFSQRLSKLHDEIELSTSALNVLREEARTIRQYRDRVSRLNETVVQLERTVNDLRTHQELTVTSLRNQHIDEVVNVHHHDLANIQRQLTEKVSLEGIIKDLARDHDEVALDHMASSLLAQALSPTEGLIAEQLTGFISCLVSQLNSVLQSIWTYDMTILPCGLGVESSELDYKFPIKTGFGEPTADISKGSKGQEQVINLAFQLTVMLYMGLTDYPIYLDEPTEGFDEQHRVNLMSFVKQLMDVGSYTQMFMISHYASSHGSFTAAQVMVLDASNIAVPGHYNEHVVLE